MVKDLKVVSQRRITGFLILGALGFLLAHIWIGTSMFGGVGEPGIGERWREDPLSANPIEHALDLSPIFMSSEYRGSPPFSPFGTPSIKLILWASLAGIGVVLSLAAGVIHRQAMHNDGNPPRDDKVLLIGYPATTSHMRPRDHHTALLFGMATVQVGTFLTSIVLLTLFRSAGAFGTIWGGGQSGRRDESAYDNIRLVLTVHDAVLYALGGLLFAIVVLSIGLRRFPTSFRDVSYFVFGGLTFISLGYFLGIQPSVLSWIYVVGMVGALLLLADSAIDLVIN